MNFEVTSISNEDQFTDLQSIQQTEQYKKAIEYSKSLDDMQDDFIQLIHDDALKYIEQGRGSVFVYEILPDFVLSDI